MITVLSRPFGPTRRLKQVLKQGLAALLVVFSGAAYADSSSDYAVVDDVAIYFAVLPAEMLRSFPPGSEESQMHGGVPGGRHVHHVQIALFDTRTNARITDARVVATVAEIGLGGITKDLQPFLIGGAQTYGAYFDISNHNLYKIRVRATLPVTGRVVENTFEYLHH